MFVWRLECIGVRECEIDSDRKGIIADSIKRLPTIFDCAGFGDTNTEDNREIIELLVRGKSNWYQTI